MHRTPKSGYDTSASKQTVSLTLNSDLYAQAKAFGINASKVAEEALAYVVKQKQTEQLRREIEQDIAFCNAYVEKHRAAFDAMDAHFDALRDAEPDLQPAPVSAARVPEISTRRSRSRR